MPLGQVIIVEENKKTNYDKAVTLIKSAKKLEKKGKNEKALSKYEKSSKIINKI